MYAMDFDRTDRIIFSPIPIPVNVVDGLRDSFGGRLLTDIDVCIPEDYDAWPDGAEAPAQILCVSKTNPKHYRVFKYARDMDNQRWHKAGRNWSWLDTEQQWLDFLRLHREMDQMARTATGGEAPEDAFDSDEAQDLAPAGRVL